MHMAISETEHKFGKDGIPRPYYGNTIISHIGDENKQAWEAADWFQEQLKKTSFAQNLAFLPKDSFHMTILALCRHIDRETDRWPKGISREARFPEIDRILKEKVDSVLPLGPVCMKIDQCDPTKIYLCPKDEENDRILRSFRDRVSELTGIHHPNHEKFRFHISVSYKFKPFTEEQQAECDRLCEEATKVLLERVEPFWVPEPSFVVFNDMLSFHPELSKRGELY